MSTQKICRFGMGFVAVALMGVLGCSSGPEIKQQAYAKLRSERTFEYDFPIVWKGIEEAVRGLSIEERNPKDVNPLEMQKLTERTLKTRWIFSKSRDKYIEFKVNDLPKKQYLQMRHDFEIKAERVMGGTTVQVVMKEELERLDSKGQPDGYETAENPDTSRIQELLEKIQNAILASGEPSLPGT